MVRIQAVTLSMLFAISSALAQQAQLDECIKTCQAKFTLKENAASASSSPASAPAEAPAAPAASGAASAAPLPPPPNPQDTINLVKASKNFKDGLITMIGNKTVSNQPNVIVEAPVQGNLRFVPFSVKAAVGEKLTFVLGGNGHNVVQGSALNVCAPSAAKNVFTKSGMMNITNTFDVEIADEKPLWVFCGVPTHCNKGMFMVVNPASASKEKTVSAAQWMENNKGKSSELSAQIQATIEATKDDPVAAAWGSDFSMAEEHVPAGDSAMMMAFNILNTRVSMAEMSNLNKMAGNTSAPVATAGPIADGTSGATLSHRVALGSGVATATAMLLALAV